MRTSQPGLLEGPDNVGGQQDQEDEEMMGPEIIWLIPTLEITIWANTYIYCKWN
jgi:hypothetical protein